MSDSLASGSRFRTLNVIDDCNREALHSVGPLAKPGEPVLLHHEADEREEPYDGIDHAPAPGW